MEKSRKKAKHQSEDIIVGLDVGTTKICAIVAKRNDSGGIDIIGIGKYPSNGLHRGIVVNPAKTVESIKFALEEAELNSGVAIESVSVGIAGHHIRCIQSTSTIGINNPERTITEDDINRLLEQAGLIRIPSDTQIISVIPQEYIIDGKDGIYESPVGMYGVRLDAKVNIVTGLISSIDDLSQCVKKCDVDIDDIVLEPIASSHAVLEESEKRIGVAMLDIGGGTTDIAVFKKGVLKYTAGIGIAGSLVTSDIVETLGIPEKEAERIKCEYGCAILSEIINDDDIVIDQGGRKAPKKTRKSILARIIQARMQDIFELAAIELKNSQIFNELHAGVVITGGGSLLRGTKELASKILNTDVNLGIPAGLSGGLIKEVESPIYATGVGLILHKIKTADTDAYGYTKKKSSKRKYSAKSIFLTIKKWFEDL